MKTTDREILFGAAYYPEYMPWERMDADFEMMKKAGMNVIRVAESTWSTWEPREGVFDFFCLDRLIEKAAACGLRVIVGTPTYAVPAWLAKKDPDVLVAAKDGRARYGRRQLINLLSPTYLFHAERAIRKLAERTAGKENVIGYQIDNETKHYGNFGKEIQEKFVEYLKMKFGTAEKLNQAFCLPYWSNSIASFEDFPDMAGCCNGGLAGEFSYFQRQTAAKFLRWQADIIREYKREEQFITHNLDFEWKKFGADIAPDGYSYGIQPDMDHLAASRCLSLTGCDIYHPTQDRLTGAEIAFGGDVTRSFKHKPYLVLECQAQAFKYWTPYPGQLALHAYSHLAAGAMGLLYWNWHSVHNGFETYWRGLLSHDLKENPPYREACGIGEEFRRLNNRLILAKKKNAIALAVDHRSLTALQWFPIDKNLSYNDVFRWMYDSLYEMNLECDVVDVRSLKPERYKMIITPALYCADEETLKKLDTFVKNGGVLVSSFRSFVADEQLSVYPDTQPAFLHTCFGMHYQQFTEPSSMTLLGREITRFAELLIPDEAESLGNYEHRYWNSYAGITHNLYGKGHAYYLACYTEKELLKQIYQKAATAAGLISRGVERQSVWPLIIRSGNNSAGERLHYVLHYSPEERDLACPYPLVQELRSGKIYKLNDIIPISDWDVKVLAEIDPAECAGDSPDTSQRKEPK